MPFPETTLSYVSPTSGQMYVFEFDTVLAEDHTLGAEISEHPVEAGVDIADHIRPQLAEVHLKVAVSNTPLNRVTAFAASPGVLKGDPTAQLDIYGLTSVPRNFLKVDTNSPSLLRSAQDYGLPTFGYRAAAPTVNATPATWEQEPTALGTFSYLNFDEPMDRVQAVFQIFDEIRQQGIPLELNTQLRQYPQMVLKSLRVARDGSTGVALELELREFVVVSTQQTSIKRRAGAAKTKPAEKRAEPKKLSGKSPAPTKVVTKSSLLTKGADYLRSGVR